jgi:hypothetical protein
MQEMEAEVTSVCVRYISETTKHISAIYTKSC